MLQLKYLFCFLFFTLSIVPKVMGQIYSFEQQELPSNFNIFNGKLFVSKDKFKLGKQSLRIDWKSGAKLVMCSPIGIDKASDYKNGGVTAWIYNTKSISSTAVFVFKDIDGKEVGRSDFKLGFTGWRCYWQQFHDDIGIEKRTKIKDVELIFPDIEDGGTVYIDFLEFTPNVSWQKMSDAQYNVNRTDFSLIPDFMLYRNSEKMVNNVIYANDRDIEIISDRLTGWYLGNNILSKGLFTDIREKSEFEFVSEGLKLSEKIKVNYSSDGTPVGYPLYPMCSPNKIDGEKIYQFRNFNEKILLPLALDFRKNNNEESLNKIKYIYDWFNNQGWADGSGLGTLCFEKLRSSGYFHSFFLVKDKLDDNVYQRELNTLYWFTMFGICYNLPDHAGEVADNLRALAIPKLIYALSVKDKHKRQIALTAYKAYMDNALGIAPGFFGTLKADFSGYHHRGAYNSAYYPHALYAGALIAYLLHDTPYALSETTVDNLKKGLLTFRFFSANLEIPSGTVGRFPMKQDVLQNLLPAFAYVALSYDKPDAELVAALKKIMNNTENRGKIMDYARTVNSNLAYTATVGEMKLLEKVALLNIEAEGDVKGNLFMPYSGLMVMKEAYLHFNVKGFSRYIWDFESSDKENLKGRYLSYGQLEYFDLKNKKKSFNPAEEKFDWNYIPGTTVKVLSDKELIDRGGGSSGHRHFSDETFLAGVDGFENVSMFSFRMHDISYDSSFRANKSVFSIGDYILCLGTDIQNNDDKHNTVTTIFQSFDKAWKEKTDNGCILGDASLLYAVKSGDVVLDRDGNHSCAYIQHGKAPELSGYEYYIIKNQDKALAEKLLTRKSPLEIISKNNDAHIVKDHKKGVVCGALFNIEKEYVDLIVKKVNIPLAYILKDDDNKMNLSLCEPDMRRASKDHMGLLTEDDVIQEEKPFDTKIVLNGIFNIECIQKKVDVSYNRQRNETYITISTIRGENYNLILKKQL